MIANITIYYINLHNEKEKFRMYANVVKLVQKYHLDKIKV